MSQQDEQTHREGRAILRVAQDMRNFIAAAPADDPDAQSLRRDCDTLDRVGRWLSTVTSIALTSTGIPAAGPGPHIWTPDETKNKCLICGDGVWGRHRFQSSDPNVQFKEVVMSDESTEKDPTDGKPTEAPTGDAAPIPAGETAPSE